MKLIEGMKQIKDLVRKAEDLRKRVAECSADLDIETPRYDGQKEKLAGWVQAYTDLLREILRLRFCIAKTNLNTEVAIELGGKVVTKTIAEWIHRRRDLAGLELLIWTAQSDKGLKEGQIKQSDGQARDVKIRRYYNPEERDEKINALKSEPLLIDSKLEVINAITDLMG